METKRERRCETCGAYEPGDATCHARSPDGCDDEAFPTTGLDDWCLVDYTPMDMMNGLPDREELQAKQPLDLLECVSDSGGKLIIDRINENTKAIGEIAVGARDTLRAIERWHDDSDEVARGDDS